jgi:hypothetical protein
LDASLDLDLKLRGTARCIFVGMYDDIIEREASVAPLELNMIYCCAR